MGGTSTDGLNNTRGRAEPTLYRPITPPRRILITGVAGFIGGHLAERLLHQNIQVVGIDNLNHYYDQRLKHQTLDILRHVARKDSSSPHNFTFLKTDLTKSNEVQIVFKDKGPFDCIIHLAAQAGVRYSIQNPIDSAQHNIIATLNMLEYSAQYYPKSHFIMASSSSVYGADSESPFDERQEECNRPLSVYAASKKSNEMFAYTYNSLYDLPITMFRFFTVYGPRGRPDMSVYKFIEAMVQDKELPVYGDGTAIREFTYISDIIDGLMASIKRGPSPLNFNITDDVTVMNQCLSNEVVVIPVPQSLSESKYNAHNAVKDGTVLSTTDASTTNSEDSYRHSVSDSSSYFASGTARSKVDVFNIGGGSTHTVMELIKTIESVLNKKAKINFQSNQLGDVPLTTASQEHIHDVLQFKPKVSLLEGISQTVKWYIEWDKLKDSMLCE